MFVSFIMMINVEGNDKSRKLPMVHVCVCTVYIHIHNMDTHTLKQKGKMANNLNITLQKKSLKTEFNQLRQAEDEQGGR